MTLTYDLGDRLIEALDSINGTITRKYGTSGTSLASGLDFMTQEKSPQGTVNYTPDNAGRRTQMSWTAGTNSQTVNYTYDYADNLQTVVPSGASGTTIGYDNDERRQTVTLPNGVVTTYVYDADSNVTSITYKKGGTTTLGNLTYSYDSDDRKVGVGGSFASTSIPSPQTFAYNNDNSLSSFGPYTVTNDSNGEITCLYSGCNTSNHVGAISYDARGHLQQAIGFAPDGVNIYEVDATYDGFGRGIGAEVAYNGIGPIADTYLYDGLNAVATQTSAGPVVGGILVGLGLDDTFMESFNGVPSVDFLKDALNSYAATTDPSGNLQQTCSYDPYGNTPDADAASCAYISRENDLDGLYFLRGRYYSPQLQRFVSRDPIGVGGGTNIYAYAGDDPVDMSDPTGDDAVVVVGGCYGDCIGVFTTLGGVALGGHGFGGIAWPGLALLPNQGGLGSDIVARYLGQNGGGLGQVTLAQWSRNAERQRIFQQQLDNAMRQYPKKASQPDELHHIFPQYWGYPKQGPKAPLNPAYHQMITNLMRKLVPYGQPQNLSDAQRTELLIEIYELFPIFF